MKACNAVALMAIAGAQASAQIHEGDIAVDHRAGDNLKLVKLIVKVTGMTPVRRIRFGIGGDGKGIAAIRQGQPFNGDGQESFATLQDGRNRMIVGIAGPKIVAIELVDQDAKNRLAQCFLCPVMNTYGHRL